MNILANYHCHTTFCDGKNTPEEMLIKAISLGFKHLGFSGHMDEHVAVDLKAYIKEINRLKEKYKDQIEVLIGIEQDNLYKVINKQGLDYVIGSTHFISKDRIDEKIYSVDGNVEGLKKLCDTFFDGDYYKLANEYYKTESKVIERTSPTFIGHFDLVTRFNDLPIKEGGHFINEDDPRYLNSAISCMKELLKADIPFEINCGAVNRNRKKEFYPNTRLLKELHDLGGEILLSSDAHSVDYINGAFDKAILKAKECGFEYVNILTRDSKDNKPAKNTNNLYWHKISI